MIKTALIVLMILAVIVPQAQASDVVWGLAAPEAGRLLGEVTETRVNAGITMTAATAAERDGIDKTVWVGGYAFLPSAYDDLFSDYKYLRINPRLLGISPEDIRKETVTFGGDCLESASIDESGNIVINVSRLMTGQYFVGYEVTNKAGRRDYRILIFFRFHKHLEQKDNAGFVFSVVDPSRYLDEYCYGYSGCLYRAAPEAVQVIARERFLSEKVGSFQSLRPGIGYAQKESLYQRLVNGLPRPFERQQLEATETRTYPAPTTSGPVSFTLNVMCSAGAVTIKVNENGNWKSYSGSTISMCLDQGIYQAQAWIGTTRYLPFTFKVVPGMKPVDVTIK